MIGDTGVSAIEALLFIESQLYATTTGGGLYTLDTTTGEATFVANTGQDIWGMALPTVPTTCKLTDSLSYNKTNNTLTMKFTVGDNVATIWNAWLTYQNTMTDLFSVRQPITVPPESIQKTTTVSKEGKVGVFSTLTTANSGIVCSSWEQINTGTP